MHLKHPPSRNGLTKEGAPFPLHHGPHSNRTWAAMSLLNMAAFFSARESAPHPSP